MKSLSLISCLVCISATFSPCFGQPSPLSATYTETKLPWGLAASQAVYDGEDSIYLFGGFGHEEQSYTNEILHFNITSEEVQVIGTLPGIFYVYGSVQMDSRGDFYYFGADGFGARDGVMKFSPKSNTSERVATLPNGSVEDSCSVKYPNSDEVNIFAGGIYPASAIVRFSMLTLTSTNVGNLTRSVYLAACAQIGTKVYIFGNSFPGRQSGLDAVIQVDLDTYEVSTVEAITPDISYYPTAVGAGSYAYLIGGYRATTGETGGMYQYNPITQEFIFLPVENFPVGPGGTHEDHVQFETSPAAVYVERSNRIYFFGGEATDADQNDIFHNDIWYIDLSPIN